MNTNPLSTIRNLSPEAKDNLTKIYSFCFLVTEGLEAIARDLQSPENLTDKALTGEEYAGLLATMIDVQKKYLNILETQMQPKPAEPKAN